MSETAVKQELGPNQRKWVDALRSGEYEQGRRYLRLGNKCCCLGVGCEVFGLERYTCENLGDAENKYYYKGYSDVAPSELVSLLALRDRNAKVSGEQVAGFSTLTSANDSGNSFVTIANFIESHPEAVFTEAR